MPPSAFAVKQCFSHLFRSDNPLTVRLFLDEGATEEVDLTGYQPQPLGSMLCRDFDATNTAEVRFGPIAGTCTPKAITLFDAGGSAIWTLPITAKRVLVGACLYFEPGDIHIFG